MKGLFIFLSLMMMAAVLHLSVATHYCGGKEAASSVSLQVSWLIAAGRIKNELALSGTNLPDTAVKTLLHF